MSRPMKLSNKTMKSALFIIPQIGFNDVELFTIRDILFKNSIECHIASYSLGTAISKTGKTINADRNICSLKVKEYDCFIFVGGENVSSLVEHKCVIELVKKAYKEKKLLALLCVNPALILPKASLIEGRKVTVFNTKNNWSTDFIKENKGILVDEPIVVDENIITCRDEKDAKELADLLLEILK